MARVFSLHDSGFPRAVVYGLAEDDEGGILIGAQYRAYRFFEGPAGNASRRGHSHARDWRRGVLLVSGN